MTEAELSLGGSRDKQVEANQSTATEETNCSKQPKDESNFHLNLFKDMPFDKDVNEKTLTEKISNRIEKFKTKNKIQNLTRHKGQLMEVLGYVAVKNEVQKESQPASMIRDSDPTGINWLN